MEENSCPGEKVPSQAISFFYPGPRQEGRTLTFQRGIRAQTELALSRVEQRLKEAGASMEDVVKFVWYLTNRKVEEAFYEARDGWLEKHAPVLFRERSYASTLLIVGLARPDMLVEVDCTAYIPGGD